MKKLLALFCVALTMNVMFAGPVRAIVSEAIEFAAKRSGKALGPLAKKATGEAIEKACTRYGDDVLKAIKSGGLEAVEQGAKHGDDFWRLCKLNPQAARSLALNADTLIPHAKRIGPEFLQLEGKLPGLALEATKHYGDDAIRTLAKIPKDDAAKLITFAKHADSPKTVSKLFANYSKYGSKFLKALDAKKIVALGLTGAMLMVSDNICDNMDAIAQTHPAWFAAASTMSEVVLLLLIIMLLFPTLLPRAIGAFFMKKKNNTQPLPQANPTANPKSAHATKKIVA